MYPVPITKWLEASHALIFSPGVASIHRNNSVHGICIKGGRAMADLRHNSIIKRRVNMNGGLGGMSAEVCLCR